MKILSSFSHPQVVPNLYEFLIKEDILKNVGNQFRVAIKFHIFIIFHIYFPTMEINVKTKLIQVLNYLRESK